MQVGFARALEVLERVQSIIFRESCPCRLASGTEPSPSGPSRRVYEFARINRSFTVLNLGPIRVARFGSPQFDNRGYAKPDGLIYRVAQTWLVYRTLLRLRLGITNRSYRTIQNGGITYVLIWRPS